jgi:hypothetical protein
MPEGEIRGRAMRKFVTVLLLGLAAPMPVVAKTQYILQPRPTGGQQELWRDGKHGVQDTGAVTSVVVTQEHDALPGNPSAFRIFVINNSSAAFNFGPENVAVELADGTRVGMLTVASLRQRVERDTKRRQFFAGLGGALQAGSANGYTTGDFDYSGQVGGAHTSGSGTFSYNDPVAAQREQQAVQAQTDANFRALRERQAGAMQALGGLIQTTTVAPGKIFGGIVAYDPPVALKRAKGPQTATIVVTAGSAVHRIVATIEETN